jgi:hypothetical protein
MGSSLVNSLVAGSIFAVFLLLSLNARMASVRLMLLFLCVLGLIRRQVAQLVGYAEQDPILLVGPAYAFFITAWHLFQTRLVLDRKSARLAAILAGIMVLQVFNPFQGGILIGLAGVLFYLVPLVWYFLGFGFRSPGLLTAVINTMMIVCVVSALYGLKQVYFGYSEAELVWQRFTGFAVEVSQKVQRPYSFFSSPAEFTHVLTIGFVLFFCQLLAGKRFAVVPLAVLGMTTVLSGQRGAVVSLMGTSVLLWVIQSRQWQIWGVRLLMALAVLMLVGGWTITRLQTFQLSDSSSELVGHQIEGLTDPLGKKSTLGIHLNLVQEGMLRGITNPIGYGLGATSHTSRLTDSKDKSDLYSAEFDVADMFVSLGVVGGVTYVLFLFQCIRKSLFSWTRNRDFEGLCILGCILVSLGQIAYGGQYFCAMFFWLALGAFDATRAD